MAGLTSNVAIAVSSLAGLFRAGENGGMKWEKKLIVPFVLAALLLLPLSAYVAGYFWLCDGIYSMGYSYRARAYPYRWMAVIFYPAARIESAITGDDLGTDFLVPNS